MRKCWFLFHFHYPHNGQNQIAVIECVEVNGPTHVAVLKKLCEDKVRKNHPEYGLVIASSIIGESFVLSDDYFKEENAEVSQ